MPAARSIILCITMLTLQAVAWTPSMTPPWSVADIATLIEAVGIQDRPRQRTVALLVEDFSWDWQRIVALHATRMAPPRGDDSAWKLAHQASESEARRIKGMQARLANATPSEAARLRARIERRKDSADALRQATANARARLHTGRRRTDQAAAAAAFETEAKRLNQELLDNIHVILLDEELAAFDSYARNNARRRRLRAAWIEGEALDLDALVAGMHPPLCEASMAASETVLSAWRRRLDDALDARDAANDASKAALADTTDATSPARMVAIHTARLDASRAVRDCTLSHLDTLASAVLEEEAVRLRHVGLATAFPRFYRPTDAMVAIQWSLDQGAVRDVRLDALLKQHASRISDVRREGFAEYLRQDGLDILRSLSITHMDDPAALPVEATDRSTDEAVLKETRRALAMLRAIIGSEAAEEAVLRGRATAGGPFPLGQERRSGHDTRSP